MLEENPCSSNTGPEATWSLAQGSICSVERQVSEKIVIWCEKKHNGILVIKLAPRIAHYLLVMIGMSPERGDYFRLRDGEHVVFLERIR